ncbi:MAG: pyridoxal-phosphate dependent enzyme [Anaerolineales bacterium]|nr:pyridoxal-phosphate dependent enzyme [Anaerolineales bacterium]
MGEQMLPIFCSTCGTPFPDGAGAHLCPDCGGLFEIEEDYFTNHLIYGQEDSGSPARRSASAAQVSLGEGWTPLVPMEVFGRTVYFKCEQLNPTGSFKDRATVVLVNALRRHGVTAAVEDSSGNAGASFAAYAAAAGMQARIFMPAYASGPKKLQIEAYGARIELVEGPRSAATEAILEEVAKGAVYASHGYLPHGLAGIAEMASELVAQLGEPPGGVIAPAGHGSILLGLAYGFEAYQRAGKLETLPALIGVQAQACAPLYALFNYGEQAAEEVKELETIAEGIRIRTPYRAEAVVEHVRRSGGTMLAVGEEEIAAGHFALRTRGLYVEKTSAVVWPALEKTLASLADPVVVILSGSGLKQACL